MNGVNSVIKKLLDDGSVITPRSLALIAKVSFVEAERELAAVAATTPFGCKTTYTVVLKTAEGLKIKSMSHDEKKDLKDGEYTRITVASIIPASAMATSIQRWNVETAARYETLKNKDAFSVLTESLGRCVTLTGFSHAERKFVQPAPIAAPPSVVPKPSVGLSLTGKPTPSPSSMVSLVRSSSSPAKPKKAKSGLHAMMSAGVSKSTASSSAGMSLSAKPSEKAARSAPTPAAAPPAKKKKSSLLEMSENLEKGISSRNRVIVSESDEDEDEVNEEEERLKEEEERRKEMEEEEERDRQIEAARLVAIEAEKERKKEAAKKKQEAKKVEEQEQKTNEETPKNLAVQDMPQISATKKRTRMERKRVTNDKGMKVWMEVEVEIDESELPHAPVSQPRPVPLKKTPSSVAASKPKKTIVDKGKKKNQSIASFFSKRS